MMPMPFDPRPGEVKQLKSYILELEAENEVLRQQNTGMIEDQLRMEKAKLPLAIGHLKHSITARAAQDIVIITKGIKLILKHSRYSEMLEVKELLVTPIDGREGIAHPSGAVVEVSFNPSSMTSFSPSRDCEICGKKNPAEIHTCTPTDN